MTTCRAAACRAQIRWARTEAGRWMPLDHHPLDLAAACAEPRGVFFLDDRGVAIAWSVSIVIDVGELYRAHWATCLDRDHFRQEATDGT